MEKIKEIIFDRKVLELFFISLLALYIELMLIRWISSEIRIFAYFKNIVLISSFVGLGLGCALAEKIERKWSISFFILFFITAFSSYLGLTYIIFVNPRKFYLLGSAFNEHITASSGLDTATIAFAIFIIVAVFFLNVEAFLFLGLRLGKLLNEFTPIVAYSINILGSLIGVILFAIISALWLPPVLWVVIAGLGLFYFCKRVGISVLIVAAIMFIASFILPSTEDVVWSPYYKIDVVNTHTEIPYMLYINNDKFQPVLNAEKIKHKRLLSNHYDFTYELAETRPDDVLIVGAGSGNDAAFALKHGAKHVDAIEIDPAILELGKKFHPQDPYDNNKVNPVAEDARSFIKRTDKKYDFVIFGTLDSHMVISSFSSLRLDNYVYTYESIKEAYSLLKDNGMFAVTIYLTTDWLRDRIFNTIKEVTGQEPVVITSAFSGFSEYTFLVGPLKKDIDHILKEKNLTITDNKIFKNSHVIFTTDDWPFLFLEKPTIPVHYILPLLILVVLSGILIYFLLAKTGCDFDLHMFFLGAAFMLLEVKAIAKLALMFGSTWIVNSIVIASILFLILIANIVKYKYKDINFIWVYILLAIAIIIDFIIPASFLSGSDSMLRISVNTLIACLPVFFAAIIFANSFAKVEKPNIALGSNLFGAMVGGALEYVSMLTGIRFLAIVVLILYLLSFLTINKSLNSRLSSTIES